MSLTKLDKPAGTWTYEDLFALPYDGKRYEIIEGTLFELPPVGLAHATAVTHLLAALLPFGKSQGWTVLTAPIDVFLPRANPVQPDILVILPGGAARLVARGVEGPPDLIIEVVTPTNRDYDTLTKSALYGLARVREYWIVDPEARTLELFTLDRDAFHQTALMSGDEQVESPLLGPLSITVDSLFPTIEE
jgi:Uma2 family endonuclease